MRKFLYHLIFLLFPTFFFSQGDSVLFNAGIALPDMVYPDYHDFRRTRGIGKNEIVSEADKSQQDFISKALAARELAFVRSGVKYTVATDKVWGYTQNNTLYVNYRGEFYRVPVFGAVSYVVATVTVMTPGFYDPRFGYPAGNTRSTELREFLMSFYDGRLRELSTDEAKELFSSDTQLSEEFRKAGKRKQKSELYRFIRRYNERNPVYFLRD